MSRALPRILLALGALVIAWLVAGSIPDHTPFYGGDCGSVSDWASNEDSGCNEPLLDRACVVAALLAGAAILVLDAIVQAQGSTTVRISNVVVWTLAPPLALLAANQITDGTTWPSAAVAVLTLTATVALLAALPVGAAVPWRARATVLAIAAAASVAVFAYAQMLWSGNGA